MPSKYDSLESKQIIPLFHHKHLA